MCDKRSAIGGKTEINTWPTLPPQRLAELEWNVIGYHYWDNKREFLLQTDVYEYWCLFAVEDGSFAYEIGNVQGTAGSGSVVLCPPLSDFRRTMLAPALTFHFVQLSLKDRHRNCGESEGEGMKTDSLPVQFTPGDRQRLFDTFDKWRKIDELSLPNQHDLLSHYWNDVWKTWCLERTVTAVSRDGARSDDELMSLAARRLEARCAEPFSVKELADELGLSSVQLIRRFRSAYKVTPGDYLTGLRMEKACRLLRETRMTVEQIALACGYATGYYLSRLFAAQIGISPSEYRNRHRV